MALSPERQTIIASFKLTANKCPQWGLINDDMRSTIIRRIERSCYNVNISECIRDGINRVSNDPKYLARYSTICYKLQCNIDPDIVGSAYLIGEIILFMNTKGKEGIDPSKVAEMSSGELCPGANKPVRDTINLRLKQKMDRKVSNKHTCKKCGKNSTVPIEFQGRSADEASSRSIKCVFCGHVWQG